MKTKLVKTLREAIQLCGLKDGMTVSFHHHLRNGDYVVNMVMQAAFEELGLEDITIAATSLGEAHDPVAQYIEMGKVTGIQTSGIRGMVGEVVSAGKLKTPALFEATAADRVPSKPVKCILILLLLLHRPVTVSVIAAASEARAIAALWAMP